MVAPNHQRPPAEEPSAAWPVVFIEPDPEARPQPAKRRTGWIVAAVVAGIAVPVTSWFAGRSAARTAVEPVPVPMPITATPAPAAPAAARPAETASEPLALPTHARPSPKPRPNPPPRATPVSSEPAHLYVNAVPWGLVSIDDNPIGNTPLVGLPLAPGTHRIRVEHAGYAAYTREIHLAPGETLRLTDIVLQETEP